MAIRLVECLEWEAFHIPGELLKYTLEFKRKGVDLDALWAYTSNRDEPKIAAISKQPEKLAKTLRALGMRAKRSRCIYLTGVDKPGGLRRVLDILAKAKINIEYLDALATGGKFAATIWVADRDLARARRVLGAR